MENALDNLHPLNGENIGPVLQDGGLPVDGSRGPWAAPNGGVGEDAPADGRGVTRTGGIPKKKAAPGGRPSSASMQRNVRTSRTRPFGCWPAFRRVVLVERLAVSEPFGLEARPNRSLSPKAMP